MMRDDGLMIKHDDFKLLRGFADKQNDGRTDTGDCRVAFATENNSQHLSVKNLKKL